MSVFLREFPDEESQTKEIYARFGLAAYMASVFEEAVAIEATLLALVNDVRTKKITSEEAWQKRYDEEMAKAHRMPLGPALSRLRKLLKISDELAQLFEEVLIARNKLIHHFFRDEIHEFYNAAGRTRMYEKLMSWVDLFSQADKELVAATRELRNKIGLTDEKLSLGLEQLEVGFRAR